jgi:hypothetical protein
VRKVLKWLTSTDTTAVLDVYYEHKDDSNVIDWSAIGGWTEISTYKLGNNRIAGIVATFEAITPYAMSNLKSVNQTVSDYTNNSITIDIDTDDNKPVYPKITINHGYNSTPHSAIRIANGTVYNDLTDMIPNTIYYNGSTYYWKSPEKTNSTTKPSYSWETIERTGDYVNTDVIESNKIYHYAGSGRYYWIDPFYFHSSGSAHSLATTGVRIKNTRTDVGTLDAVMIKNNTSTERIVMDGANRIISSTNTSRILGEDFNWKWLELYNGRNVITIEGNCAVTIEWREVRKVGEY